MTSEREKKRIVSEGLRRLRNKPGWDPTRPKTDPTQQLTELQSQLRTNKAMGEAPECAACNEAEDGLCEEHLAAALGF